MYKVTQIHFASIVIIDNHPQNVIFFGKHDHQSLITLARKRKNAILKLF